MLLFDYKLSAVNDVDTTLCLTESLAMEVVNLFSDYFRLPFYFMNTCGTVGDSNAETLGEGGLTIANGDRIAQDGG